jgi:phosphate transport system permease protein
MKMTATIPNERENADAQALARPGPGQTFLPLTEEKSDLVVQPKRKLGGSSRTDRLNVLGAAAAGLSVALLLFGRLAAFSGILGFAAVAYLVFLLVYVRLVALTEDPPTVRDKLMSALMTSAAVLVLVALVVVIFFTFWRGKDAIFFHGNFFAQDMRNAGPLDPLTVGGIKHALVGTLWMTGIALVITVPLGLTCAVYLNESKSRVSGFVRTVVDAMTALPSIVAGLFIYATWILTLHQDKSGLAAGFAISVMMLPIIIRASDVVLRLIPGNLREASAALGAPEWRTVWHVVLPTARSGLATAIILGTARGIGETAPVLLTAGFTANLNTNPVHGPMVSLPLVAFQFVRSPQKALIARGFAAAAFLLSVVLVLFVVARVLGGRGPGRVSRRGAKRIARASAADVARFESRNTAALRESAGAGSRPTRVTAPADPVAPGDNQPPPSVWNEASLQVQPVPPTAHEPQSPLSPEVETVRPPPRPRSGPPPWEGQA